MSSDAILGWIVVSLFALDVFLLFTLGVIVHSLKSVRQLRKTAAVLGGTRLDRPLGPNERLDVMSARLLRDLLCPANRLKSSIVPVLGFPIGRLITIVHISDHRVHKIVREFRWYAFMIAILFLQGVLWRSVEMEEFSFSRLIRALGHAPQHVLDLIAVGAALLTLFRLATEVSRLGELLQRPY